MNASPARTSPKSAPKATSWAYAEDLLPESEAATTAREQAATFGLAPLTRGSAATLTVLARAVQAKAVVEIGTGSGVSGLALFAGMQRDGILTSVDTEAEHQQAARRAFGAVGVPSQRFRLIAGSALNVLPRLSDGAYDLVFVDGDVGEYADYVDQALRLLRHGGVLVLNHAFAADRVPDPANTDSETESVRAALAAVTENEDLVPTLLPVGTGLLVAVKK